MSDSEIKSLLARFDAGEVAASELPHEAHIKLAYGALKEERYPEALARLSRGLLGVATRAGVPDRFHHTITGAFVSIIAERMFSAPDADYADLIGRNPDLLDSALVSRIYGKERLALPIARSTFILPIPPGD